MQRFDQINVIPFIDIMLVLLAIVLTTATFVAQGTIPVELPAAENGAPPPARTPLEIVIDRDGAYFLSDENVDLETLDTRLAELPPATPLLLRVDARAQFEAFVNLADRLKAHGLEQVSILTRREG